MEYESSFIKGTRELERGWECWEQGFHPVVGTMGRNLPRRINIMPRADDGKEIDKINGRSLSRSKE